MRPHWLELAYEEMNNSVAEVPGPNSNPRIVAYFNETSFKTTDDNVAWCSAFVCAVLEWSGIPSTRSAAARSYLYWGDELREPKDGCIAVLYRGSRDGTSGHCAFFVGQTADKIMLLGGNQMDKVCILAYPKSQVLSYRWPSKEVRTSDAGNNSDTYYRN